jgi:hypothetical protein
MHTHATLSFPHFGKGEQIEIHTPQVTPVKAAPKAVGKSIKTPPQKVAPANKHAENKAPTDANTPALATKIGLKAPGPGLKRPASADPKKPASAGLKPPAIGLKAPSASGLKKTAVKASMDEPAKKSVEGASQIKTPVKGFKTTRYEAYTYTYTYIYAYTYLYAHTHTHTHTHIHIHTHTHTHTGLKTGSVWQTEEKSGAAFRRLLPGGH